MSAAWYVSRYYLGCSAGTRVLCFFLALRTLPIGGQNLGVLGRCVFSTPSSFSHLTSISGCQAVQSSQRCAFLAVGGLHGRGKVCRREGRCIGNRYPFLFWRSTGQARLPSNRAACSNDENRAPCMMYYFSLLVLAALCALSACLSPGKAFWLRDAT